MAYALKKKNGKHILAKKTEVPSMGPMHPSLSLSEKDLPAIKNWKVGQTYTILVKAKQTAMSQGEMYGMSEGKKDMHARFEVLSAEESK